MDHYSLSCSLRFLYTLRTMDKHIHYCLYGYTSHIPSQHSHKQYTIFLGSIYNDLCLIVSSSQLANYPGSGRYYPRTLKPQDIFQPEGDLSVNKEIIDEIVTIDKVVWAISTFDPYKSPGQDISGNATESLRQSSIISN